MNITLLYISVTLLLLLTRTWEIYLFLFLYYLSYIGLCVQGNAVTESGFYAIGERKQTLTRLFPITLVE